MLTSSVIPILIAEPGNNRKLPCSTGEDCTALSFASSFDADLSLASFGGIQNNAAKSPVVEDSLNPKIDLSIKKSDSSPISVAGRRIQSNQGKIQSQLNMEVSPHPSVNSEVAKVISNFSNTPPNGTPPLSRKGDADDETSLSPQEEMPGIKLLSGPPGIVAALDVPPVTVENSKAEASDESPVPQPVALNREVSTALADEEMSTQGTKDRSKFVIQKNAEAIPDKDTFKTHSGSAKNEKKEKVAKAEKLESTDGIVGSASGTQVPIAAPFTLPSLAQEPKCASQSNSGPSIDISPQGPSPAIPAPAAVKVESKAADVKQTAGDHDDAPVRPAGDHGTTQRPELGSEKMLAGPFTQGETKTQDKRAEATPILTERGVAGATSGIVFNSSGSHIVTKPQTADAHLYSMTMQSDAERSIGPGNNIVESAHRTLLATPTTLEVGIASGAHGWLKVRAELASGGAVNASLSTASSSGQEMLHRELPSLTEYLHTERVAVNTIVIQSPPPMAADFRGLTSGLNGDTRGQAQQHDGRGGENRQHPAQAQMNPLHNSLKYIGASGIKSDELLPRLSYAGNGSWLSVRA